MILNVEEAPKTALQAYGNSILRTAYAYTHNMADAEDVLQDTLLRFMEKNPHFESPEHEKAWLLRVAINLSKNKLRTVWFRREEIPEAYADVQPGEGEPAVLQAVKQLDVKYREVIHLYFYEEYSTEEIARMLGKNPSTVRSLLHRAKLILKDKLKGEYDFGE